MGTFGDLWGPMGADGDPLASRGTFGDLWAPLGTHGHLWGPMGAYGGLWGPIGTFGDLWAPLGAHGGLWGPIRTFLFATFPGHTFPPFFHFGVQSLCYFCLPLDPPPVDKNIRHLLGQTAHTTSLIRHQTSDFIHIADVDQGQRSAHYQSEGQVHGLNRDRVAARYDDLLRALPPDCIDDLLLVPVVRMFCAVLFRLYLIFSAI